MSSENIAAFIPVIIIIAVAIAVMIALLLVNKRADTICREFIDRHFSELRLINQCVFTSGFFPASGILALLNDRMVFVSFFTRKRKEVPLAEITKIKVPRFWLPNKQRTKGFEVHLGQQKIRITVNMCVMNAWKLALEKSSPTLASQIASAPIK